jgi:hypothetical protein
MKVLSFLHVLLAENFYKWAMREIHPGHPDVPKIIMRQLELSDKRKSIEATFGQA